MMRVSSGLIPAVGSSSKSSRGRLASAKTTYEAADRAATAAGDERAVPRSISSGELDRAAHSGRIDAEVAEAGRVRQPIGGQAPEWSE